MNGEGGGTKKVLAMLKGEYKMFWGSFQHESLKF